jgi:hypothetical protein
MEFLLDQNLCLRVYVRNLKVDMTTQMAPSLEARYRRRHLGAQQIIMQINSLHL